MKQTIFWDVDTQYDFMMPDGKLYVPKAEEIIPHLKKLTEFAREKSIQIMGSIDFHSQTDSEISDQPDFVHTYPPHCLANEPGHEKIPETSPLNPLWIDSEPIPEKELKQKIEAHKGEIYFRKQQFDVFTNPNTRVVLEWVNPKNIIVYGVALDVCDAYAIEGFLAMGRYKIYLVTDAVKPINEDRAQKLMEKWKAQGVKFITTSEVMEWKL